MHDDRQGATALRQSRIEIVPEGWRLDRVGTVCSIRDELRLPINQAERQRKQGPYPYYGPTGIVGLIDEYRAEGKYALIGEDGDHFLKFADRPMTQLAAGQFNVNNHAHIIADTSSCSVEWFYYYFMHRDITSFLSRQGAGRYKLTKATLENLPILVPPLAEQYKVATILADWDYAIELMARLITAKQYRKRGLTQQLLSGRQRIKRFISSEGTHHTALSNMPVDWQVKPLSDLVQPISRSEPIKHDKEYRLIGVRWYTEGAHIHTTLPGKQIATTVLSRVESGDITYNKMWASKAAFAITKPEHAGAFGTTEYPQFRADPDKLSTPFLEQVFRDPRFQHEAKNLCRGSTERARLNPSDFLQIEIPVPTLFEQECIADILQSCDEEVRLLGYKLVLLKKQKQGLMQQLLTGRVRVQV